MENVKWRHIILHTVGALALALAATYFGIAMVVNNTIEVFSKLINLL